MKLLLPFLLVALISVVGCQSVEDQRRWFAEIQNSEIGLPFYAHERNGRREVKISDTQSEFIPDPLPSIGYGVAWMVDTTTRGPYLHPNGMTFQIEGMKKSWRIVGDPEKALMKTYWGVI